MNIKYQSLEMYRLRKRFNLILKNKRYQFMTHYNPYCLGSYNFDNIALYARKRFIEGYNTIELMQQAQSNRQRQEIALVEMMDIDDTTVKNLKLSCQYKEQCKVTTCHSVIKETIENSLKNIPH